MLSVSDFIRIAIEFSHIAVIFPKPNHGLEIISAITLRVSSAI
jgi:hypothetical protein